jgi:hypothetical protein
MELSVLLFHVQTAKDGEEDRENVGPRMGTVMHTQAAVYNRNDEMILRLSLAAGVYTCDRDGAVEK